jgi:hypothetical protein
MRKPKSWWVSGRSRDIRGKPNQRDEAVMAGISVWQQIKMPERVFERAARFLSAQANGNDNT